MKALIRKWAERFLDWMKGRSGVDQLSMVSLLAGLLFLLLASVTGVGLLALLSFGLYAWTLFRVFSGKKSKRAEENRKFVDFLSSVKTRVRQFFLRLKNRKQFKYFRCPKCKVLIRVSRGGGEKEMHCPRCRAEIKVKT